MFLDSILLTIKGGNGGNGCVSFIHTKSRDGGPDGGNGGKGGNVYIQGKKGLNNLHYLQWHKNIVAEDGQAGSKNCRTGKNGKNKLIFVPIGTDILFLDKIITINNENVILLSRGGKGGSGNKKLASSTNRKPTYSTEGEVIEPIQVELKLKIVADVGIIGAPNSGKSSLLNRITGAKSKVADFAFSTTYPQLGCYELITFIDVPGIIKDASIGKGLGLDFLAHAEKCKILLLLIDISHLPFETYEMLLKEIHTYGLNKEILLCFNKCDLVSNSFQKKIKLHFPNSSFISTIYGKKSIEKLVEKIKSKLKLYYEISS